MTKPIVKYAQAPHLVYNYPSCGNCHVEVESDDGDFICRPCGTMWSSGAGDDDPGQLYELWSGEVLDVPVTDPDDGWRTAGDFERKRLEAERTEQNARALVVQAERAAAEVAARATLWSIPAQDLPRSLCCDDQQRVTPTSKLLCIACGTEDKSTATSIVRDVERAHRRAERESARVTADPKHVETIEARLARGRLGGGGFACGPGPSLSAEDAETIERLRHRSSLPKAERDLRVLRDYAAAGDPEAIRLLAEREATTNEMETTT